MLFRLLRFLCAGFNYVQNAAPDGPVAWAFKRAAETPLRCARHVLCVVRVMCSLCVLCDVPVGPLPAAGSLQHLMCVECDG